MALSFKVFHFKGLQMYETFETSQKSCEKKLEKFSEFLTIMASRC